jgi:hypothetical protein
VLDISWLSRALEILRDPEIAAVYPRWRGVDESGNEVLVPDHEWDIRKAHEARSPWAHHLAIMRRANVQQFFEEVGNRSMVRDQDVLLVHSQARFGRLVRVATLRAANAAFAAAVAAGMNLAPGVSSKVAARDRH